MHDLEQPEIDCRVLLGAIELLKETDPAHALVEEPDEHAVLRPDPAVLARQVLHDVVGGRRQRVFGGFDLIGRRAAGPGVDLELLDRLGDLVHELAGPGARQRRAQPSEEQKQRGGRAHERARRHRDEVDRHVRRHGRGRHRLRRAGRRVEILRRGRRRVHPRIPVPLSRSGRLVRRPRRSVRRGLAACRRRGLLRRRVGDRRRRGGVGRGASFPGAARGAWRPWRRRPASARIGTDDGSVASAERIVVVAHRRSSLTAQSSICSSGQSPAKCIPIAVA